MPRTCLWAMLVLTLCGPMHANALDELTFPVVEPGRQLTFPRDHGAHPDFRTEWWYVTGWLRSDGAERGFQVTFFRHRPGMQENNVSTFAPKQLLFAHAAVSDIAHGRLSHDQRIAREGFDLAYARTADTDVAIDKWKLVRSGEDYKATIVADRFALDLRLSPKQPVLLQGESGYSRKGPQPGQASYYYSVPHLQVSGTVVVDGKVSDVNGEAWLDHEWSSEYLPAGARGWDWVSVNLEDGGAIMAFRMRNPEQGALWAGGSVRDAKGKLTTLSPQQIGFEPMRQWTSPRTGIEYPVAMRVVAGEYQFELEPTMDDQELDSSMSTGIIYWEGAVRAKMNGKVVGRGYLELTGYGSRPEM